MNESFKVIDVSYLLDAADNSPKLVLEVIYIFKTQIPDFENKFISGIQQRDIVGLKKNAHKIKSAMSVMGIRAFDDQLHYFDNKKPEELKLIEFEVFLQSFRLICEDALEELNHVIEKLKN